MDKHRLLRILSVITAFISYLMLLMGAIVTKTGSGEGCGNSWPFCHGQLIPASMPVQTVIEFSHRAISGLATILILVLTVWSWTTYRESRRVKLFGLMSIFFVMLQAVLGGLTVKFRGVLAKKTALALHFGFSLICFASVVLLCIHLFQRRQGGVAEQGQPEGISGSLHWSVWGLTVFTYVVVYTGALVRHAKATMGCGYAFPTCGTTIFPNLSSLAGIHMLHRYAAAALWVLVLWFMVAVLRTCRERKDLVKGSVLSFALITLQALSGIATVESGGQLIVALIHTTIISVFFSILCYLCMQVGLPWKRTQWVRKDETVLT